jgi:hypothetical protein
VYWLLAVSVALAFRAEPTAGLCRATCSCAWQRDIAKARDLATAVMEGVALDSTFGAPVTDSAQGFVKVRLVVGQVWKGELPDTVGVVTRDPGSACGFRFVQGERYLVFAHRTLSGELEVSMCSPSVRWKEARGARKALGQPSRTGAA